MGAAKFQAEMAQGIVEGVDRFITRTSEMLPASGEIKNLHGKQEHIYAKQNSKNKTRMIMRECIHAMDVYPIANRR